MLGCACIKQGNFISTGDAPRHHGNREPIGGDEVRPQGFRPACGDTANERLAAMVREFIKNLRHRIYLPFHITYRSLFDVSNAEL